MKLFHIINRFHIQWKYICILILSLLIISSINALGRGEVYTDPVYGTTFPLELRNSQKLPESVYEGSVVLRGLLVSLGHSPFTKVALKTADNNYYILPELWAKQFVSADHDHSVHANNSSLETAHEETSIPHAGHFHLNLDSHLEISGELYVVAEYFIDNSLAFVEYRITEIHGISSL